MSQENIYKNALNKILDFWVSTQNLDTPPIQWAEEMALIARDALDETLRQEMYDIKMYAWVLKNKLDGGRYPGFMDDLRALVKILTEAIDERDNIQPTKCS